MSAKGCRQTQGDSGEKSMTKSSPKINADNSKQFFWSTVQFPQKSDVTRFYLGGIQPANEHIYEDSSFISAFSEIPVPPPPPPTLHKPPPFSHSCPCKPGGRGSIAPSGFINTSLPKVLLFYVCIYHTCFHSLLAYSCRNIRLESTQPGSPLHVTDAKEFSFSEDLYKHTLWYFGWLSIRHLTQR